MKSKIIVLLSVLLCAVMLLSACAPAVVPSESTTATDTPTNSPDTTAAPTIETTAQQVEETTATPTVETTATPTVETTADEQTTAAPEIFKDPPKSLKILAIGNSFSTDGMQYLYQIAKSAGVDEVILGNLYIGGCSLATHLSHAKQGDGAYTYYKNTGGNWVSSSGKKMLEGIKDENWDYITLQQTSKTCGLPASYGATLTELVNFVVANKPTAETQLLWHMTWAYQQNSTHSSFPNYKNDQMTMYNMIIDTTKQCINTNENFEFIIPCATSIQNARTSFVGDTLTRDGYHLSYILGRYIAGLTWYASITGASLDNVTYTPSTTEVTGDVLAMAKEAVANSVKTPLAVTESTYKTGTITPDTGSSTETKQELADFFEADKTLAATIGVDLSKYRVLEIDLDNNAYWYCTKSFDKTYPKEGGSTYKQNVCTMDILTKTEVPENSLIICDTGWQYRPELWPSMTQVASSRPSITTNNITLMDAAWWGNNTCFAYNISSNPKSDISEKYDIATTHVRVYVPVTP